MPRWNCRVLALSMLSAAVATAALAGQERTGSHLDSRAARPTAVFLNEPSAIDEILKLIQAGRHQEAVVLADNHVNSLRTTKVAEERIGPDTLYYALNALCVAQTTSGLIEEGLLTCTEAIARAPRHWSAWNSRGTTHFANTTFEAAVADFQRAHALAPKADSIIDTIEWNIRLARERLNDQ